jgi:glycosyltransferase involved in cell wall biosynthesis
LKKVAFILEEDDIYSWSGGNSLTITLHDILKFGFKNFTPTVIGKQNEAPFPSGKFVALSSPSRRSYLANMREALKRIQPDVVVSLQSFRLAFLAKSWDPKTPVVLYRHNLVRKKNRFSAFAFNNRLRKIDRFIFCSHFIRNHFVAQYPKTTDRADTVWNGFELDAWHPAAPGSRKKEIVLAGRCHPEKGVKEAALAIAEVLSQKPEWNARMLLSFTERFPDLFETIKAVSAPFQQRFCVQQNASYEEVKTAYENAAICLVPSIWAEPFGRVAAEGHLGGCCVISSGSGGLREVSADSAFYLDNTTPEAISAALLTMIEDPKTRESLALKGNKRANQLFSLGDSADSFESALISTLNH